MEEVKVYEAKGLNPRTGIPGSVFIGYLRGTHSDCMEFIELTRPGFVDECTDGKSLLREMKVWEINDQSLAKAYVRKGRERPKR